MPLKNKNVTIRDVATMAGTSPATVSRVLSDSGYPVAQDLRTRVLSAAEKLEYVYLPPARQSLSAQKREAKRQGVLGLVLPNVSNPFYSQAITGVENTAKQRGYQVLICNTLRNKVRERQYLQLLMDMNIRDIILSSVDLQADNIREFLEKGAQFVLLDQQVDDVDCVHVNFDMYNGATMAVNYLISQGHTKIALATTPLVRWTRTQVYRGYKDALAAANLPYNDKQVFISSSEIEVEEDGYDILAGRQLAQIIAEHRNEYTAVLCVNDITAAGLLSGLASLGISVPDDLSIVSMDDIPFATAFKPELTTIRYPAYEGGKLAASLLLDLMDRSTRYGMSMKIEPRLIIRKSVKKLNCGNEQA